MTFGNINTSFLGNNVKGSDSCNKVSTKKAKVSLVHLNRVLSLVFITDIIHVNLKQAKVFKCLPNNKTEHLKVKDWDLEFKDLSNITKLVIMAVSFCASFFEFRLWQVKVVTLHAVIVTNVEVEHILHVEDS